MTKPAACFLLYLDRYLAQDTARWRKLAALYKKHTGRAITHGTMWKHWKRKVEPNLSTSLVYQIFLHQAGELIPSAVPGELFNYKHPEWLKK